MRQGSGPQVMVGVRNLMIDECFFSGKTSLAAGNRRGLRGFACSLDRRAPRVPGRGVHDVTIYAV